MLKTETNTPAMHKRVAIAFRKWRNVRQYPGNFSVDFEHGQWWVHHLTSGAQWSVVDAEGGPAIDGFDFEQVAEGEEA